MPDVLVTDTETGEQSFVPSESFDPSRQELAPDQVATVTPLGDPGEFPTGQAITAGTLGDILPEVTPEARAELTRERVQEGFDTTGNTVKQALRGAAAGASLGVSELLLRDRDPFALEQTQREREAGGSAFLAGEIGGSIVPGLLSGGAGFAGTLARLTPAGRAAAMAGRLAAGGRSGAGKLARSLGAQAFEGAADGLGQTLAQQALAEHPDFSAESLLLGAGRGALFGAAVGAGGAVIGAAGKRAARAVRGGTPRTPAASLDAGDTLVQALDDTPMARLLQADDAARNTFVGKRVDIGDLVTARSRREAPEEFSRLVGTIDDAAKASRGRDLNKLLATPGLVLADTQRARLNRILGELDGASTRAKAWASDYADAIGIDDIRKATREELAKEVPEELEERAAAALAELDETHDSYRLAIADIRVSGGLGTPADKRIVQRFRGQAEAEKARLTQLREQAAAQPTPTADVAPPPAKKGRGRGIGESVTSAVGAAELARDAGVDLPLPSVRDVPLFGDALGAYTRIKAGARLLGKAGVSVPQSSATKAAGKVNTTRDRIGQAVRAVARRGAKIAARPATQRIARKATRELMAEVTTTDPAQSDEQVSRATAGAPPAVQQAARASAARSLDYLQTTAPPNPLQGTPWADDWKPAEIDAVEWRRRYNAAIDPEAAILRILQDPGATVEAETVRVVAPALWAATREDLIGQIDELADGLAENKALSIGRAFDLPLHRSQAPGYGTFPVTPPEGKARGPRPSAGPGPNSSPIAQGDALPK